MSSSSIDQITIQRARGEQILVRLTGKFQTGDQAESVEIAVMVQKSDEPLSALQDAAILRARELLLSLVRSEKLRLAEKKSQSS